MKRHSNPADAECPTKHYCSNFRDNRADTPIDNSKKI